MLRSLLFAAALALTADTLPEVVPAAPASAAGSEIAGVRGRGRGGRRRPRRRRGRVNFRIGQAPVVLGVAPAVA